MKKLILLNVNSIQVATDNQNSNINNLYSNNYRSLISRYSNRTVNITIAFERLQFEFDYNKGNFTSSDVNSIKNYLKNFYDGNDFLNYGRNNLNATNINDNTTYTIDVAYNSNLTQFDVYFDIYGSINFDMPLKNVQLLEANNAADIYSTTLNRDLFPVQISINNKSTYLKQVFINRIYYTITYNFDYVLQNVDYMYFFNEMQLFDNDNTSLNFDYNTSYNVIVNNNNYSLSMTNNVVSRASYLFNLQNDSRVNNFSCNYKTSSGWQSFVYNQNVDHTIGLHISIFTPFFANDNQYFIQNNTNGSVTPLKLEYYDAKWYELHYQLANAFIFLITELPIISNITNAVYSTINVIQTAFNTLSEFSAFGYIFAFGMFALVFGILIKLLIGD